MKKSIFRTVKQTRFTTIDNLPFSKDSNLSLKARGLLITALCLPDDWVFHLNGLNTILKKDGMTSIKSAIKELKQAGYFVVETKRNKQGRIEAKHYTLYENPLDCNLDNKSENHQMEKPPIENHQMENHSLLNNNYTNKINNKTITDDVPQPENNELESIFPLPEKNHHHHFKDSDIQEEMLPTPFENKTDPLIVKQEDFYKKAKELFRKHDFPFRQADFSYYYELGQKCNYDIALFTYKFDLYVNSDFRIQMGYPVTPKGLSVAWRKLKAIGEEPEESPGMKKFKAIKMVSNL